MRASWYRSFFQNKYFVRMLLSFSPLSSQLCLLLLLPVTLHETDAHDAGVALSADITQKKCTSLIEPFPIKETRRRRSIRVSQINLCRSRVARSSTIKPKRPRPICPHQGDRRGMNRVHFTVPLEESQRLEEGPEIASLKAPVSFRLTARGITTLNRGW